MGLLKAFGAAATSLGSSLQEAGALKHKEDLLEEQRNWEWKKMEWLADKESTAATTASRIDAYKTILDQVGKEITSIDKTLGGTPNVIHSGYDKEYLNARRKALATLSARASSLLMGKSGIPQDEISAFFEATKKIATTKPGDDTKLTEKEKKVLDDNTEEGGGFWASIWEGRPKEFLKDTPAKVHFLGEAIKNIAWENDILLNSIKKWYHSAYGPGPIIEDEDIRKTIATVLEGDESVVNAKSEEDVKNIIKDKGILNSILDKIKSALEADTPEEWEGTRFEGMTPGEIEEIQNQEAEQVGYDESIGMGQVASHPGQGGHVGGPDDPDLTIPQMEARARAGVDPYNEIQDWHPMFRSPSSESYTSWAGTHPSIMGDSQSGTDQGLLSQATDATTELGQSSVEQPYQDYAPTVPAYDAGSLTEATTEVGQSYAPAPTEPYDVNYVEGRKAGTTEITSMTVGEIAEQYGYGTRVGIMALTYNEIIDLVQKYFYKDMSRKEVRERVDKIPFGDKIQKDLLYLSLGED